MVSEKFKWDGEYPVRARIVDAEGVEVYPGMVAATPEESRPFIGQEGIAYRINDFIIRIDLDDGRQIHGYECWWTPIGPAPENLDSGD